MSRVRIPTLPRAPRATLPPELRWDTPAATVAMLLSRREFLRALGVLLAALSVPVLRVERAAARVRGRFFTKPERATLEALCDRIIPPEPGVPGARDLGAATYIEGFLTALDGKKTRLFAGGPFSGRNPFPDDETGTPSRRRPRNGFKKFIRPTRLQDLYWRGELFGTAGISELATLDTQSGGPKKGLRDVYRESLAKVDEVAQATKGGSFATLTAADQDTVLAMLDAGAFKPDPRRGNATFVDLLIQHTLEGCFSPPEYGGNKEAQGWAMIGLEGDSQPLGYSIFSQATGGYVERPDHPMSTPNPDEIGPGGVLQPRPLTAEGQLVQTTIATFTSLVFGDACKGG
ncbi:MAG: gluconate 2-dehydrogenase subunit 3 family protein, partial [Candidatus Binatia bacterium]